uniref:chitinase n=1 Tax=Glossina austeni TaxID=7395 RepID=A0A1A9V627_GLOAU
MLLIKCLTLVLVCLCDHRLKAESKERKHVICYHGTWSAYRPSYGKFDVATDIDPFLCTHLMYAFFGIQENGDLRIIDPYLDLEDNYGRGNIRKFNSLKMKNPTLKTLAAVGGWNEGSKKFSIVAADPEKRARFVQSVVELIQRHGFDGLDLDWEYPNQRHRLGNNDRENYIALLKDLKEGLEPFGYLLTAAVGSVQLSAEMSYDIPEMCKYLDVVNVMAYDLHGPWDQAVGINAPLHAGLADNTDYTRQLNLEAIVKYWLSKGTPRNKLVIGVPFYGRTFNLENPLQHNVGAPHTGRGIPGSYSREPGVIGYNELCELFQKEPDQWHLDWDEQQMVPYAYHDNQWVGYENEESIALKADYIMAEDLAGIMVWSIESDDFRGICSSQRYPLLRLINNKMHGDLVLDLQKDVNYEPLSLPIIDSKFIDNFQCSSENGYVRDLKNCSKFYFCDSGFTYNFECISPLKFDINILACNYPNLVDCN